jgi:hypothetical protein
MALLRGTTVSHLIHSSRHVYFFSFHWTQQGKFWMWLCLMADLSVTLNFQVLLPEGLGCLLVNDVTFMLYICYCVRHN